MGQKIEKESWYGRSLQERRIEIPSWLKRKKASPMLRTEEVIEEEGQSEKKKKLRLGAYLGSPFKVLGID